MCVCVIYKLKKWADLDLSMTVAPQKKKLQFKSNRQFAYPGLSSVTLHSRSGLSFLKYILPIDNAPVFAQNMLWHLRHIWRFLPHLCKKNLSSKVVPVVSKCRDMLEVTYCSTVPVQELADLRPDDSGRGDTAPSELLQQQGTCGAVFPVRGLPQSRVPA